MMHDAVPVLIKNDIWYMLKEEHLVYVQRNENSHPRLGSIS